MNRKTALAVFTILAGSMCLTVSGYNFMMAITTPNTGNVGALAAYWDANLTQPVTNITWDTVYPGSVQNMTMYLANYATHPCNATFTTTNWTPTNGSLYLMVTWDHGPVFYMPAGFTAGPYFEKVVVTLTASVDAADIKGPFSFDTVFTGVW